MPKKDAIKRHDNDGYDRTGERAPKLTDRAVKTALAAFHVRMLEELEANMYKGGATNWRSCSSLGSLLYGVDEHLNKLRRAVSENNWKQIDEYAADTANMLMMLWDLGRIQTSEVPNG